MAERFENLPDLRRAVFKAITAGDSIGLLTVLRSAKGRDVSSDWAIQGAICTAAEQGDLECLRVLDMCGFKLPKLTWALAAGGGHIDCLEFAVSRGYTLDDYVLEVAIKYSQLASVDFLIKQGLPLKPYMHREGRVKPYMYQGGRFEPYMYQEGRDKPYMYDGGRVEPDKLKCFQLMADKGVHIDARCMQAAVECRDLDFVRWLHHHGVPLWKHAVQHRRNVTLYKGIDGELASSETLHIPAQPERVQAIWKALRYGAVHGAPITPTVVGVLNAKRRRSRTVLMCFKVVERRCQAALPSALVEEILTLADLEIWESMLAPAR